MVRLLAPLVGAILFALTATGARAAQPSAALSAAAAQVIDFFEGSATAEEVFAPAMLAQVPAAQLGAVRDQLRAQFGEARSVERIDAASPWAGTAHYRFARARVEMRIAVAPEPPHLITGLFVTDSAVLDDSLEAVAEEIAGLPGRTTFAVARLDGAAPDYLIERNAGAPMAIGSAFKLYILAELIRQVEAGERRWSDVVPLSHRSLPSGMLQGWPQGVPVTLHTLAALMISISDNSATDTLLHLLGRENVEAMMARTGHHDPSLNTPFLGTLDLFLLKGSSDATLRRDWLAGDAAARRALLPRLEQTSRETVDPGVMSGNPVLIEEIEWFASGRDLVALLGWIDEHADQTARDILAINPGIGGGARRWAWLGFKGGSEPGVLNLSFVGSTRAGESYAVTASWNNPDAPVEETTFAALLGRALALLAE